MRDRGLSLSLALFSRRLGRRLERKVENDDDGREAYGGIRRRATWGMSETLAIRLS